MLNVFVIIMMNTIIIIIMAAVDGGAEYLFNDQQHRKRLNWISSPAAAALKTSIITQSFFCSMQWLTRSVISEGALFIHSHLLNDIATSFAAEFFWGDAAGSFPQTHSPSPLKQNNAISHKLWGLIALNRMRSVWLYHAVEANISVLKIQSGTAIIEKENDRDRERERKRWWGPIGVIISPR